MPVIERALVVPAGVEHTFSYFSEPRNLPQITPPWLRFTVVRCPVDGISAGCEIEYTIAWLGVTMPWTTRITQYERDARFVDTQERGPYKRWWHEHRFQATAGGTLMSDRIEYEMPFGVLGGVAHAVFVRRQLRQILDYRARRAAELFPSVAPTAPASPTASS